MKLMHITAAAALTLALAGPVSAAGSGPLEMSELELDGVVAAGAYDGQLNRFSIRNRNCNCSTSGLVNILSGILNGNEVNVLSGNNTALGIGILGTGAILAPL